MGALSAKVAGDIATPSNAPAARDSDEQYDTKMSLHARRQSASTLRLRALKADTKSHAGAYENPRVARIPRHFAASMQAVAASGGLGIRALIAVLVFVALLPNLVIGALFFFGVVDTPWSRPVTSPPSLTQSPSPLPRPVLSVPDTLSATAGERMAFPIALDGTDGVPIGSIIIISGLPRGAIFSSGRAYDEAEWKLQTGEIGDLHLVLPRNASGEAQLAIELLEPDGAIIADTATILKVTSDRENNDEISHEAKVLDERTPTVETEVGEERLANLDAATATSENPVPLPTRRPTPSAKKNFDSIKPLAFVNLREGPSPSARIIVVVPKGAKLRVIRRKNRWVQVTDSATSKSGWIYTGNVENVR